MAAETVPACGPGSPDYPSLLRALPDAPPLYRRGEPPAPHAIAIVGSRAPSAYGRRLARRLARGAAGAGLAVVSGLARGIDAEAHEGCLEAGGKTWAVLGCGLDRIYPPENEALARRIVESGGGLLSEHPDGVAPFKGCFPRRNRIIAGLCWATVVVEGREGSGAASTADAALALGRELLAVPGLADSPLSAIPHRLLRQGAALACDIGDVIASLPPDCGFASLVEKKSRQEPMARPALSSEEQKIVELLAAQDLTLEELGAAAGIDAARLSVIIFGLEMQDLVVASPGQRYGKR